MFVALLSSLMILANAAPSAAAAEGVKAAPSANADHKDKLVCKNDVVAGTRVPKKVCLLQSQIDANRDAGRAALEKAQLNTRGPSGN